MTPFAHGLMFHHFCDDRHPRGQGAISAGELEALLQYVGLENILPADAWMSRALSGRLQSHEVCLTFDDALRCQYDIALPVLERHGLTAFWFVYSGVFEGQRPPLEIYRWFRTTQFADVDAFYAAFEQSACDLEHGARVEAGLRRFDPSRYLAQYSYFSTADRRFRFIRDEILSPAQYERIMDAMISARGIELDPLASLLWMDDACLVDLHRKGHLIGLHSYSHPTVLARLPVHEQESEYARNASHLERLLGCVPETMSHPSNSYGAETLEILQRLGVRLGFRADMEQAPGPVLEFPREDHAHVMARMRSA